MKTSELEGAELDYWVARITKTDGRLDELPSKHNKNVFNFYSPSTDWQQGGPLIEEYGLEIKPYTYTHKDAAVISWQALSLFATPPAQVEYGPTPLIAAMRCLVSSKFGDSVG